MTTASPQIAPAAQHAAPSEPRDLLQLRGMHADTLRSLLHATHQYAKAPASQRWNDLAGTFLANLFFEDSTRTRLSFSVAARRLGADVLDLAGAGSSHSKGESLVDAARNIEAIASGRCIMAVRSGDCGGAQSIANAVQSPVINAGDGRHEHPTQGLLDVYTLATAHNRTDSFDLAGLTVAIVGDIAHSRVARSDVAAMTTLGAEVVFVGPETLAPSSVAVLGGSIERDFDAVLPSVDAVQMLRIQFERNAAVDNLRAYTEAYQLHGARVQKMKPGAVVMHPGPMNRGVEITGNAADNTRSRILHQAEAGVFVRMAALARAAT